MNLPTLATRDPLARCPFRFDPAAPAPQIRESAPLSPKPIRIPASIGNAKIIGSALAALILAPLSHSAAELKLNGHTFSLPDGFTVEVAADNDLAPRPIAGSFDESGRLYITDSSGSNKPPAEQLKDPQSRILRLEDSDGDGRFDRTSVFADKVMFPQGCLWHAGSVYVAGPPSIWKFTDTDGDGKADQRTEWYQGNILTGCANDVHGPYLGPEGMLYWTKGAFGRLNLRDGKGRLLQDRCAHIFRAWPDGSGMESVMSGGMDNPVEVAFTPEGEPIVISTFIDLSQPGRRDGLGHAVYGGVFGKINDVVEETMVRRTGDLLPTMTHFGPAAACALTRYESDSFGPDYRNNLFGTLFNLRKVTRHQLKPAGSSFATIDSDFLVSDQADFHPTDVFEDVDGSLLVVDTGGWYKLCCPSSQLAKADVLGAVYRVRRTGATALPSSTRKGAYARWVAPPRLNGAAEEVALKKAVLAAKPESSGLFRSTLERNISKATESADAARLARLSAEGLGRIGDRGSVDALFGALALSEKGAKAKDRFLEHSLLFALIEIGDADATRRHLQSQDSTIQRAALLVLEQIGERSGVLLADVLPLLAQPEGAARTAGLWVARRHPEWGAGLAQHFRTRLGSPTTTENEKSSWEGMLDLLAKRGEGQAFLAEAASNPSFRHQTRAAAFAAMATAGLKELPTGWKDAVLAGLRTPAAAPGRPGTIAAAVRGVRSLPFAKEGDAEVTRELKSLLADQTLPDALRLDIAGALPPGTALEAAEFSQILIGLDAGRPPNERLAAASALPRLKLTAGQRLALIPHVSTVGPIELPRVVQSFAGSDDVALGRQLVAALQSSKAIRSLRADDLKPAIAGFPPDIQNAALAVLAAAQTDASQDRLRLDTLLAELQSLNGDIRRGQAIFNSPKAACASCHRLGYLGGDLGPDLTSIGTSRTERDLLEAVIYPSASFVRSYEPWIASTKDGEEYGGVLRRDTPDEIILATGPGAETRIPRSQLAEWRLGSLSTMPAGLDEQLSKQDMADLLAFLKNTKWGAN